MAAYETALFGLAIFFLGFILKRAGVLSEADSKPLSKILLFAILPAVIIQAIWSARLEASLLNLFASAFAVVIPLTVLGFAFARLLKLEGPVKGSFVTAFPSLEGALIAYPAILAVFGAEGLSRFVVFDIGNALYLFTAVYAISTISGKGKFDSREIAPMLAFNPLIWADAIGFALNLSGYQNATLSSFLSMAGAPLLFLVMLSFGIEFHPHLGALKLPALSIALKTGAGLAIGVAVASLFGLTGIGRASVIVGAQLPPSILCFVFAKEHGLDSKYLANLSSIALPIGLVVSTIVAGMLA
ncbi:MAG: AEC family transporter [Candidatus ainarchaeum sp.]|nr:AEC family transporter [Candidatus ainarchaeum sp.]